MNETIKNLISVFKNWKYVLLAFLISLVFYVFNSIISNIGQLPQLLKNTGVFGTVKFYLLLAITYGQTILPSSYAGLILLSVLLGVLVSLLVYKQLLFTKTGTGKKAGLFSIFGVLFATIVPGCAACGIGIISLLGFGSVLVSVFPYDGLELTILAIILLGISIIKTSKNLYSCKVKS